MVEYLKLGWNNENDNDGEKGWWFVGTYLTTRLEYGDVSNI